ncbi:MAG: TlyA family RNA methyltransferase [Dictyoglomus sp.]|nr:TlyA family RNA methyltransferase [Dictyoglomus sp.]MCX7941788.1 TlyA family RNA methyltransferase [Dictyoglomaceae bacterium]MDW8188110.1 TlyA family RNA methyltransferase [Dictyoglomus sp.]
MKERIDILLVKKGFFESREKAKRALMAGLVIVNGRLIDKPDMRFPTEVKIEIKKSLPYVSKGGFKLKKALEIFKLNVKDFVVLDIGASTGGFTDCLLKEGAKKVYALDVGKGILHESLRNDPRVVVMEGVNARYIKSEDFQEKFDLITIDVSFISLLKIFPRLPNLLKECGKIIALIKPQFEAGPDKVKRGGIVRDLEVHVEIVKKIVNEVKSLNFFLENLTYFFSKKGKGNIEYPSLFGKENKEIDFEKIIKEAWNLWNLRLYSKE